MKIKQINSITSLIYICYSLDNELITKYHIKSDFGFNECCKDSIEILNEENTKVFGVFNNSNLLAYFAEYVKDNIKTMPTIFIIPKYRNQKDKIWNEIKKYFNGVFYNAIYEKNIPAINFCKKRGKIINTITNNNQNVIVFEFEGE